MGETPLYVIRFKAPSRHADTEPVTCHSATLTDGDEMASSAFG